MSENKRNFEIFDSSAETRSFIYQQISELEPYLTNETQVSVSAKNPIGLMVHLESDGVHIPKDRLKTMHRIAIKLVDQDAQIEAEGLHEELFEAVKIAKEKMIRQLSEIQDRVISNQDRQAQINHYLQAGNIH